MRRDRRDWYFLGFHVVRYRTMGTSSPAFGIQVWRARGSRTTLDIWTGNILWAVSRVDWR